MRALYTLGLLYVVVCGSLVWLGVGVRPTVTPTPTVPAQRPSHAASQLTGPEWFQRMKPFCNVVEVETRMRFEPPPAGGEGSAYGAGCYALAGKIDHARALILALDAGQRQSAADVVFELAHPVADAGDDKSAGPIMELVVEFSTYNYMAMYHAGASEFALGQPALAKQHLTRFLELYQQADGWRSSAQSMLAKIAGQ
jgi:hypothetical protein